MLAAEKARILENLRKKRIFKFQVPKADESIEKSMVTTWLNGTGKENVKPKIISITRMSPSNTKFVDEILKGKRKLNATVENNLQNKKQKI